jgi:hypothetical protein
MLTDHSSEGEVVMTGNADEVGQPSFVINDPSVVKEVEAEFTAYYRALATNDVAALNRFLASLSGSAVGPVGHVPFEQRTNAVHEYAHDGHCDHAGKHQPNLKPRRRCQHQVADAAV